MTEPDAQQNETDLSTATLLEIWEELKTRCTGVVLVYDRPERGNVDNKLALLDVMYHGCSKAHCLGLAECASMQMRRWCQASSEEDPDAADEIDDG